jgi:hypothetical protein
MPSVLANLNELTAIAVNDYLHVLDTSDVTDPDKRIRQDNLLLGVAKKSGTPAFGNIANWIDANTIQDSTIAYADVARLGVAQTFSTLKTFSAGINLGGQTLSIYQESTWTPVIQGSGGNPTMTYGVQSGIFTRIGRVVFYIVTLSIAAISGGSGDIRVTLPSSVVTGGIGSAYLSGIDLPGTPVSVTVNATAGAAYATLQSIQDNAAASPAQISGLSPSDVIAGSGFYFA